MVGGQRVLWFLVLSLSLSLACQPGEANPEDEAQEVANSQGPFLLVAVDPVSWELVRRLPVGSAPIGFLITPDDRVAYVANTADDKLTVIDLVNWEVVGEVITGDEPDGMAWVG
jgi:YVTN family beta-propeller protein